MFDADAANLVTLDNPGVNRLVKHWLGRCGAEDGRRMIVGIAGVPGGGKSTAAQKLVDAANAGVPDIAVAIGLDGFHLPHAELERRGLVERKGGPDTFDAQAYIALLSRLRDRAANLPYPIYDRSVHEPVQRPEHRTTAATRLIVTEGNYLLLAASPWTQLARVLDESAWLDTPPDRARDWLWQRHRAGGRSEAQATIRCRFDRRNARLVLARRRQPDWILRWSL